MSFRRQILYLVPSGVSDCSWALEPCCFNLLRARTVEEALALASTAAFDLYLVSRRGLKDSGAEFCRKIRSFDQDTPILLSLEPPLSGEDFAPSQDCAREAIRCSADAWEIEEALIRLISQAESRRRVRIRASLNCPRVNQPAARTRTFDKVA